MNIRKHYKRKLKKNYSITNVVYKIQNSALYNQIIAPI